MPIFRLARYKKGFSMCRNPMPVDNALDFINMHANIALAKCKRRRVDNKFDNNAHGMHGTYS